MAVDIRRTTVLCMPRQQWPDRESSPERTKIWFEPKPKNTVQKVPVIYYLSRNGQLEHPHFMEVPLISSPKGLYLQDVMNRLNFLRGQDMAKLYFLVFKTELQKWICVARLIQERSHIPVSRP
ncbi:protein SOSEKI 5-like [Carya illinoinensis]|uniref:protein SOSEKI 5-like n=1 Tax=Carya illinoinensis TaxID=32201 RepID=UPI001C722B2D|nr:protein SOSEKI 5-like [Carya illinoinensis]